MTSFLKRRLLSLALAVSVTFNLAVLVGFMIGGGPGWGPFGGPFGGPPGGPPGPKSPLGPALDLDRAAHVLALTEEQRGKLAEIKNDRDRIFPAIDEQAQLLDHDLHDELAKEQADSATVRQILERQAQLSTERRMAQADLFERFQQVLTVEQRHRLHEELSKRPPREPPPPEAVRRFDTNGDGRLDHDERVTAERELRDRRHLRGPRGPRGPRDDAPPEFVNGLPPLWPFFDRDEDGQLNDAERAERDEFVRTHRRSRAFSPDGPAGAPAANRP